MWSIRKSIVGKWESTWQSFFYSRPWPPHVLRPCRFLRVFLFAALLVVFGTQPVRGADRMYFTGLTDLNRDTGTTDIVLIWGELEGTIDDDIAQFRLYRKSQGGDYTLLTTITNALQDQSTLRNYFYQPGEAHLRDDLLNMLQDIDSTINSGNFHTRLHNLLDPAHEAHDSLQTMLLTRMNRNVARARGRGYIDRSVSAGTFTYMLTGVPAGGGETPPLGIVEVSADSQTVLPAPEGFAQVRVGTCSESRKNIDHARVHFNWQIPSGPELMALRVSTYGYDLYRSTSDLGTLNLRQNVPDTLTKVNEVPIVVAGNSPAEGPDGYLAVDDGGALYGSTALQPGATLYYYLVARDLAGNYSATAGPLVATVPDTVGPVMVWNVHTRQEMVDSGAVSEPRMTLAWDRVNAINYLKNYQYGRTICTSSPKRVCYAAEAEGCEQGAQFCVDLEVEEYLVYRFDSFDTAVHLGGDRDGDYWPDETEDINENGLVDLGETDPCDPTDHPPGTPPLLIAVIDFSDTAYVRTLDNGKAVQIFHDPVPTADNKVYWYRIATRDAAGNYGPISPPTRGALWDRSQPDASGTVEVKQCSYGVTNYSWGEGWCQRPTIPGEHIITTVLDPLGEATEFALYQACGVDTAYQYKEIYRGPLGIGRVDVSPEQELAEYISLYGCTLDCGGIAIRFFAADGSLLAQSGPIDTAEICDNEFGCVVLEESCSWQLVTPAGTGTTVRRGDFVKVCADLEIGQCARVFQNIGGEMAPVTRMYKETGGTMVADQRICRQTAADDLCRYIDIQGIVTMDACLGIRAFSENHIGSAMHYLPCLTVMSGPPQAPIMEGLSPLGTQQLPRFSARWSAPAEGMAGFLLQITTPNRTFYETVWNGTPNTATGQYQSTFPIVPEEKTEQVCVRARALDSGLKMSDWSSEASCGVWGEGLDPVYLPWPKVGQIPTGDDLMAFVVAGEKVGAVVLSEDLTGALTTWESTRDCVEEPYRVPICNDSSHCLNDIEFECGVCSRLDAWNRQGKFIIYRQEENRDFVQVSPLVEKIHCYRNYVLESGYIQNILDDPLVFLVKLTPTAIDGAPRDVELALGNSFRLVFADWYPHRSGTRVRYKLVRVTAQGAEPETIHTSNWITLP